MKDENLSLFSLSQLTANEILVEEQVGKLENVRFRYFKRFLSSQKFFKRKVLMSKILGAIIFGILPIIPLITYFEMISFINEGYVSIERILFAGSILFGIYMLFQFFNFFLMAMLNTMKILSGTIFEWLETLPISRTKLKKLILLTIIRSLDIPLIAITVAFPIIMLIGTQNLIIFLICLGVSTLDTIFSLALLILFSERLNRILNINNIGAKKTHIIRLSNLASYIIIVGGSVFLIQWALNSADNFFLAFARSQFPTLIVMILSLIPYPFAPGYLISSFISPNWIPISIWFNILIGFCLFLILVYLIYEQSIKGIQKSSFSTNKIDNKKNVIKSSTQKSQITIKIRSPVRAFIRKDYIIASRNLKSFLSFIMPIIIGFIFTITYNTTNIRGITPFNIDFIYNMFVIIGFNLIFSGMIINGVLNIEESGSSILAALPLIPRDQAKAKLILMSLIQTITVLAPSLMYIGQDVFLNSLFTALLALPLVILLLIIMFEMWIYLFGKSKKIIIIEELKPEKRILKWTLIFIIEYLLFILLLFLSFNAYDVQGIRSLIYFELFFVFIGLIVVSNIFSRLFSIKKTSIGFKERELFLPIKGKQTWFTQHSWISVIIILLLNIVFLYLIPLFSYLVFTIIFVGRWLFPFIFYFFQFFSFNIFYVLLWIVINPLILGVPSGKMPIHHYLNRIIFGEVNPNRKKVFLSIILFIPFIIISYNIFNMGSSGIFYFLGPLVFSMTFILIFSFYFWQEFAFLGIIFPLSLSKVKKWNAIILNSLTFSIIQILLLFPNVYFIYFNIFWYQQITSIIFLSFLYNFFAGVFYIFLYTRTKNLIITSSIAVLLSYFLLNMIIDLLFLPNFYRIY